MFRSGWRSAIAFTVICLSLAASLAANSKAVKITGATIAGTALTIDGDNFTSKTAPSVRLQGIELTVTSVTDTRIVATLPGTPLAAGNYLLSVMRGMRGQGKPIDEDRDDHRIAVFSVTAGAVGPQGPRGPVGLNWRGAFDITQQYEPHDAVLHAGSSWLAVAPATNVTPGDANAGATWHMLASKGTDHDPAQLGQLQAMAIALADQINQLKAAHQNLSGQLASEVATRTNGHNSQQSRIESHEAQLKNQQGQINVLNGLVQNHEGRLDGLDSTMNSTRNDLFALRDRVDQLEGSQTWSGFKEFITTGWHSFTVPDGVKSMTVELWGGGGGGGAANSLFPGGGGGGGGYVRATMLVHPGVQYWIYVGAGGRAGTYSGLCGFGELVGAWGGEATGLDGHFSAGGGNRGEAADWGGGSPGSGGTWSNSWPSGAPWLTGLLARYGGWGSWGTTLGARGSGVGGSAPTGVSFTNGPGGGDGGWQGACQNGSPGLPGLALISW
jgi:flagellar biosynthesis chaperone FliJ